MFAFRLALHLGRLDVDAMLSEMTAAQWNEWKEYDRIDSFGEHREEFRHGQKMAQFANYQRTEASQPVHECWDYMSYTQRPVKKVADLSDEAEQARVDKEVFGI